MTANITITKDLQASSKSTRRAAEGLELALGETRAEYGTPTSLPSSAPNGLRV
jgi:hypothetical protein